MSSKSNSKQLLCCPQLPNRLRLKNLVQVNMSQDGVSNTDRMRFFGSYLSEDTAIMPNSKILAQKVTARTSKRLKKYTIGRLAMSPE
jgi:hypothetical protein